MLEWFRAKREALKRWWACFRGYHKWETIWHTRWDDSLTIVAVECAHCKAEIRLGQLPYKGEKYAPSITNLD